MLTAKTENAASLVNMHVMENEHDIRRTCPNLYRRGVFNVCNSDCILNAANFQKHVITSIMDQTITCLQDKINEVCLYFPWCWFRLKMISVFPPTYTFKISIDSDERCDDLEFATCENRLLESTSLYTGTAEQQYRTAEQQYRRLWTRPEYKRSLNLISSLDW